MTVISVVYIIGMVVAMLIFINFGGSRYNNSLGSVLVSLAVIGWPLVLSFILIGVIGYNIVEAFKKLKRK